MIKKEDMLLHAIGELPEDMVTEEDIEEIKAGARQIEKEERKRKLIYISRFMATAACIAVLTISFNAFYKPNNNSNNNTKCSEDKGANAEKGSVSVFVMDAKEKTAENFKDSVFSSKKKTIDNSHNNDVVNINRLYNMKKIPYDSTINLQLEEQTYIVFSIDTNFHLTVSNKKNETYIIKKNGKKHYIKESKTLCKAETQVHLDISNSKSVLDVVIPKWKEQGISVIAYAETNQESGDTFYIGKADGKITKNNKKGEAYYGIFLKEN